MTHDPGEPRTEKILLVAMPDCTWGVPAHLVCHDRADHYAKDEGGPVGSPGYLDVYRSEYQHAANDDFGPIDWAANNMNWEDVSASAFRVESKETPIDYQEGWVNGEKKVVAAGKVKRLD